MKNSAKKLDDRKRTSVEILGEWDQATENLNNCPFNGRTGELSPEWYFWRYICRCCDIELQAH